MNKSILIVAGGTGGHLYPGIALARALKARRWEPSFVVRRGDLGRSVLEREGFPVREVSGQGMPRRLSLKGFLFPFQVVKGSREAFRILKEQPPACVIGMGGYLSFPVLVAARLRRIPTLIHEQNVIPGLANRILGRWVNTVAVSFDESRPRFSTPSVVVTGLPIRSDTAGFDRAEARRLFELDGEMLTFLVFGGSQGAQHLNTVVVDTWKRMAERAPEPFQVLHITGERHFKAMQDAYQSLSLRAKVLPYSHQMPAAYAAANVIICRSGASTVAELIAAQRLSILVPFPFASANHQFFNAQVLAAEGVAHILTEADLSSGRLVELLKAMVTSSTPSTELTARFKRLSDKMHTTDAATRLARQVEILVGA